ncbi:MAG TPA: hypothetical protein VGP95_06465 [Gemmatimonadaceae bacterium]|nr:hypothetical protein [Gemmatimonadaceae bacterium]
MRTDWLLLLALVAACGDATKPTESVRSSLTIFGGDNQVGFDTISNLGSPFAVRVTDGLRGISGVRVQWKVVAGAGEFTSYPAGLPVSDNVTSTGFDGVAAVFFRPRSLGMNTVTASVTGTTPVEFHAVTDPSLVPPVPPDVLIEAGPVFDCTGGLDPTRYWIGADLRDSVLSARVGQRVGLRYGRHLSPVCTARFKSTDVPPGGTSFDSGVIHAGDTFEFRPNVAGTWTFVDAINGGTGTLTVKP